MFDAGCDNLGSVVDVWVSGEHLLDDVVDVSDCGVQGERAVPITVMADVRERPLQVVSVTVTLPGFLLVMKNPQGGGRCPH